MSILRSKIDHLLHPAVGEIWCLHRVIATRSKYRSNRALEITPDFLEELLQKRLAEGCHFVGLDTLLVSRSRVGRRKLINISFDDGFKDVFDNAYPILKKYNIPFTLYLTTGFADGTADVWWLGMEQMEYSETKFEEMMNRIYATAGSLPEAMHALTGLDEPYTNVRQSLITWLQVKEMVLSGLCTVGSHGVTHSALSRLSQEDCLKELRDSKSLIEQNLGIVVRHFSYPHSMINPKVAGIAHDVGYSTAAMGYGGRLRKGYDPYNLPRVYVTQP